GRWSTCRHPGPAYVTGAPARGMGVTRSEQVWRDIVDGSARCRLRYLSMLPSGQTRKMHQTTVRFSSDLWANLEDASRRLGITLAQYLREAAIARLAFAAAQRHEPVYTAALDEAMAHSVVAREIAGDSTDSSQAVLAQSQVARERARQ